MSTPPRWLSAEEQLAWRAVLDLVIEVRREMDRGVAAFDLDDDDYEILVRTVSNGAASSNASTVRPIAAACSPR